MRPIASLRARLFDDAGYTLVELLVAIALLGILLGGLAELFVSAERANTAATARLTSQQNVRLAFDRLEYDARCAQRATLQSSGAGVDLTFPTQTLPCHATGDVSWCVNSGSLVRIPGTSCTGTGQDYIDSVTSATPFSCYTVPGISSPLPELEVALSVNTTPTISGDGTTATDYITMHNAAPGNCS